MKRSWKIGFVLCLVLVMALNCLVFAEPQTSLRFMWWGGETRHKATMDAIALYMKKNPHIKIIGEYGGFDGYQQKLLTQLVGGTGADIVQIDQPWVDQLMSQDDLFVNLYTLKGLQLSGFDRNFLKNQCQWQNQLVGLPTGLNGLIYATNINFMARHKISLNTQWNWDNLVESGAKVHQQNSNEYLLDMDLTQVEQMIMMYVKQHSGIKQWINSNYTPGFDKKSLAQAFGYYQKLLQSGTLLPLKDSVLFNLKTEQNPKWATGQIGMNSNYDSTLPQFYLGGKLKLDVMLPPLMKGAKSTGITMRPSQILAINKKSAHVKEAAKFLSWFFNNPEALVCLKTERGIPATTAGLKVLEKQNLLDHNMAKGINLALKNAGVPENPLTGNEELNITFEEYIQKVGFNVLTPEAAADQMFKDYQGKLAELKAQK
ncbi:MAG TPA: ABC transporter substrate-binding protein [Firmicutes bacterium]|nr:ABC transporter substrate-binding protein [Bacillota bacterium]